jgi:hypothetical protein
LSSASAFACRGGENTPPNTLEDALSKAKFIFIGQILATSETTEALKVTTQEKIITATFAVHKKWRGVEIGKNYKFRFDNVRSCDNGRFAEYGSKWVVIAQSENEILPLASHVRRLWDEKAEKTAEAAISTALLAQKISHTTPRSGFFSPDCAPWDGQAIRLSTPPTEGRSVSVVLWNDGLKALPKKSDILFNEPLGSMKGPGQLSVCNEKIKTCENSPGKLHFLEYTPEKSMKIQLDYILDGEKHQDTFDLQYRANRAICG